MASLLVASLPGGEVTINHVLSHRLALSDVLNSLKEHLFSILSRQIRRAEFRLL